LAHPRATRARLLVLTLLLAGCAGATPAGTTPAPAAEIPVQVAAYALAQPQPCTGAFVPHTLDYRTTTLSNVAVYGIVILAFLGADTPLFLSGEIRGDASSPIHCRKYVQSTSISCRRRAWYGRIRARTSSGSATSEAAVNPTRSQNNTDTTFRSSCAGTAGCSVSCAEQ